MATAFVVWKPGSLTAKMFVNNSLSCVRNRSICRICLQSDEGDSEMRSIFEQVDESEHTLQSKLHALGFLQAYEGDGLPSHLCGWCAARLEDAYDLKRQCERSCNDLQNIRSNMVSAEEEDYCAEEVGLAVLDLSFKSSNSSVPLSSVASSDTTTNNNQKKITSSMLGCTIKMITSLRNFLSALRRLGLLVNNALRCTMDIITVSYSLLSVATNDEIDGKSILPLESEAENWETKSAMVEETIRLLHFLTTSGESSTKLYSSEVHQAIEITSDSSGVTELWSNASSSVQSFSSNDNMSKNSEERATENSVLENNQDFILPRNEGSKGSSDQISVSSNDATAALHQGFSLKPARSTVLENLTAECSSAVLPNCVTRNIDSPDLFSSPSKGRPRRKRGKASGRVGSKQRKKKTGTCRDRFKTSVVSESLTSSMATLIHAENVTASSCIASDFTSLTPSIASSVECENEPVCNAPVLRVLKTDATSPLYSCRFCEKNFSTAWNRTQHERCHTGQRPYACDVCGESFRYNVTMRNHKARYHAL